jgi:2-keto-4-pentenoate hydratase/2-oxohepta-3-ene-1,7-dioic acid hydratase in catechol pathway
MKLCRYSHAGQSGPAFYLDSTILPLRKAAEVFGRIRNQTIPVGPEDSLLPYLPHGAQFQQARTLYQWIQTGPEEVKPLAIPVNQVQLLRPVPHPPKLLLLAGNYAKHIEEGGGLAVTREKTFPYVFMKPPSTTLNDPGAAIPLPKASPHHIDYEVELGVVIGKRARHVTEEQALQYVAGYTVINDISDREYHPNPDRQLRENDKFFDWLHGKWHDGFCPAGPCVVSADAIASPQNLQLTLKLNGELRQNSNTRLQIFPVAATIEFISQSVTLEPGDILSTGTPSGVGHSEGVYLKAGDKIEAAIDGIGVLRNHVVAE